MRNHKLEIFVLLKNILCMILWVVLAIYFNRWWIALFSILTMTSVNYKFATYRICDKCGKHSPHVFSDSQEDAINEAIKAGWVHQDKGNLDFCPDCKEAIGEY